MSFYTELSNLVKVAAHGGNWRRRMRERIEQRLRDISNAPAPPPPAVSRPAPPSAPPLPALPQLPKAPTGPKPRSPKPPPPYDMSPTKPTWRPRKGDTVLINTNAVPELLGAEAKVVQVLAGGQRIVIQTTTPPYREFKCKPSAVLPAGTVDLPIPETAIPNNNKNKRALGQSSDPVVNQALTLRRNVAFDYVDLQGNYTQREVEPHYVFQALGTLNELLLTKDWKMRQGDWRCFRVEAMKNTALGEKFSLNLPATFEEVDTGIKDRLFKLNEQYPDTSDLLVHIEKDDTFNGLLGYRSHLQRKMDHDIELPKHDGPDAPRFRPRFIKDKRKR